MKLKAVILALLLVVMLAGCASGPAATPPPSATATQSPLQLTQTGYPPPFVDNGYPAGVSAPAVSSTVRVPPKPVGTPDPAKTPIIIESVTHENGTEIITIRNISSTFRSVDGNAILNPDNGLGILVPTTGLKPNEAVLVYNGVLPSGVDAKQKWSDKFMLQNAYDEVILLNRASALVYRFVYYP
jgi:hypothetical protein